MADIKNIILPMELGEGKESSVILWYKEPGDSFEEGETLVEVQTEKATYEVPAPFAGKLLEIKIKRGESATVGDVIATAN